MQNRQALPQLAGARGALLFPSDMDDYDGCRHYFMSKRGWFLGLLAAAYLLDLLDTLLKGVDHFRSLGVDYPSRRSGDPTRL